MSTLLTTEESPQASLPIRPARLLAAPTSEPIPRLDADRLGALLEDAGLTGRGGAGFPTWRKVRAVAGRDRTRGRPSGRPVVVGNGMEGEHLSRKDRELLGSNPGLVLDGLRIVAGALSASRVILATGDRDPVPVPDNDGIEVRRLPDRFLAGQESALVNALDGRPAVPADRLRPVWQHGVDGRPTLVSNVETFAQVALIARHGPAWFRAAGTAKDPGTFLVTVTGSTQGLVSRPGVREIPRGTVLRELLEETGSQLPRVRAVLVGGYHGSWVADLDVPLSREGLAAYGATPGAGVLHVLDRRHCPVRVSAEVAGYLARQTAGQCGPCVNGLPRMAQTLAALAETARRPDPRLREEVVRLTRLVTGRGACLHPDGTARLVASTLRVFSDHVEAHLRGECDAI